MYSKFEQLEEGRQITIINAALAEFGTRGYKQASTNRIVQAAGISKGILFHYFGNKKQLFTYLFDWSMDYFIEKFNREVDLSGKDIVERIRAAVEFKMKINQEFPAMFTFFQQVFVDTPPDIASEIIQRRDLAALDLYPRVYGDFDESLLREGLDKEKSIESIQWIMEGLSNAIVAELQQNSGKIDVDEAFKRSGDYFDFIRKLFYRES